MSAFALFDNVTVSDPAGLAEYARLAHPTVQQHGGRYLSVGGEVEVVEGALQLSFPVLIEFPDLGAARAWYSSPEYEPLKHLRLRSATGSAVFFETAPSALLDQPGSGATEPS